MDFPDVSNPFKIPRNTEFAPSAEDVAQLGTKLSPEEAAAKQDAEEKALFKKLYPNGYPSSPAQTSIAQYSQPSEELRWYDIENRIKSGFKSTQQDEAHAAASHWIAKQLGLKVGPVDRDFMALSTAYFGKPHDPLSAAAKIKDLLAPIKTGSGDTTNLAEQFRYYDQNMSPEGRKLARWIAATGRIDEKAIQRLPPGDRLHVLDYAMLRSGIEPGTFGSGVRQTYASLQLQIANALGAIEKITQDKRDTAKPQFGHLSESGRRDIARYTQQLALLQSQKRSWLDRAGWAVVSMAPYAVESAHPALWITMGLEFLNSFSLRLEQEGIGEKQATVIAAATAPAVTLLWTKGLGGVFAPVLKRKAAQEGISLAAAESGIVKRIAERFAAVTPGFVKGTATGTVNVSLAAGLEESVRQIAVEEGLDPEKTAAVMTETAKSTVVPFLLAGAGAAGLRRMAATPAAPLHIPYLPEARGGEGRTRESWRPEPGTPFVMDQQSAREEAIRVEAEQQRLAQVEAPKEAPAEPSQTTAAVPGKSQPEAEQAAGTAPVATPEVKAPDASAERNRLGTILMSKFDRADIDAMDIDTMRIEAERMRRGNRRMMGQGRGNVESYGLTPDESAARLGIVAPGTQKAWEVLDNTVRGIKELMPPEKQGRLPVNFDTDSPLPDFQPLDVSESAFARPFGIERIPVLGKFFGGRFNAKDPVTRAIYRYFGEYFGMGKAVASSVGTYMHGVVDKAFKPDREGNLSVQSYMPGESLRMADVFESLRRGEQRYALTPEQQAVWEGTILPLLDRIQQLRERYRLIEIPDPDGDGGDHGYFPRIVIERPDETSPDRTGEGVGSKQGFQKRRMFDMEADGWDKGYRYEPSIEARLVTAIERTYKGMADRRLASDPNIGGKLRSVKVAELKEAYYDELQTGQMTEERIERMVDSMQARGAVHQPAFAGRIFDPKVAKTLNRHLDSNVDSSLLPIIWANRITKGIKLGVDWGVSMLQGEALLLSASTRPENARIWAEANARGLQGFLSHNSFPKYLRNAENWQAAMELAQAGSPIGSLPDMMAGLAKGQPLERIPVLGKVFGSFGRQFQTFLDVAKIELWKSYREGTPKEQWPEMIQAIEAIMHMGRMESAGIGKRRILVERAALLAPSFYRGGVNAMAGALQQGKGGDALRRVIVGEMAGGLALFTGVALAMGMDWDDIRLRLDITNPSIFMRWPVHLADGTIVNVGIGGFHIGLVKLLGNVIKTSIENPEGWAKLSSDENPIVRYLRAHMAPVPSFTWDAVTGRDFMGKPVDIWRAGEQLIPLPLTPFVSKAERVPPTGLETAASFVGLTAYSQTEYQRLAKQARDFNKANGVPDNRAHYDESPFTGLDWALRLGDMEKAVEEMTKLAPKLNTSGEGKSVRTQFSEHYRRLSRHYFTGSRIREAKFFRSLSAEDRQAYRMAQADNRDLERRARKVLRAAGL